MTIGLPVFTADVTVEYVAADIKLDPTTTFGPPPADEMYTPLVVRRFVDEAVYVILEGYAG